MSNIPRSLICKSIGANYSNTYRISKLFEKDRKLIKLVKEIRVNHPFYGVKRLRLALLFDYGLTVNHKRIARICKQYNLSAKQKRKRNYKPMDKNLPDTKIPNLLIKKVQELDKNGIVKLDENNSPITIKQPIQITKPNQAWASDFTYLKFTGMWYYLATTIDVFTKEITGFHLSTNHRTDLIITALTRAIAKHNTPEIIHSDQGSEYRSMEYQNLLKANNIVPSNSTKSSPWQNGYQESFYGKFKQELELNKLPKDSTFADIYNYIANQIDYYNNYRIHTTISDIPSKFRQQFYQEKEGNTNNLKKTKVKSLTKPKTNHFTTKKKEENLVCIEGGT